MGRDGLAGAAHLELVSGVVPLRPEDAMTEAMLRGWRAQQAARGLTGRTITRRERLVRGFLECTNEFPWNWTPAHVDEWSLSLTSEKHLAPSTIRTIRWSFACSASSSSMAAMAGRWPARKPRHSSRPDLP